MPTSDPNLISAKSLCGCEACESSFAGPIAREKCKAPRIAEALAAARMEGRLDMAKRMAPVQLRRELRRAIEYVARVVAMRDSPLPGDLRNPEAEIASARATVAMLEETIKAHGEHYDRLSDRLSGEPESVPNRAPARGDESK